MSKKTETTVKAQNGNDFIADVMHWVAVEDDKPKDCESILGIEMPYEARYACHREGNLYISDETGESVIITHWMYAPEPPCAQRQRCKVRKAQALHQNRLSCTDALYSMLG